MQNLIRICYPAVALVLLLMTGCIPQKQTRYLQDLSADKDYQNPSDTLTGVTDRYFLQPNDYLFIQVRTPDTKISEFFNATSSGSSNMGQTTTRLYTYMIDDRMNVDFPYAGLINLSGCNMPMAKERIRKALEPYLKDAQVVVRLSNNSFSVLGEVRSPGVKTMHKDQITIFEAIASSGDLTPFGKRKKVILLRQTASGSQTVMLDLTDKNIVDSDYYYIYPNDVLYVRPMRAKNWGIGESFSLGIITSALALYLTITSLTK
ncbi:MAG: polysaccharide biosynthesis/export family protein [Marinilabiliaceae bacterium]|nr:polysaccharide biosynthesis/export family protein [Marinilabiliaceae bacterium]